MICTPISGGFVCGGRARRPKCSVPGCINLTDAECDYPVKRRNPSASQTCDAKLCAACKVNQGGEVDYCPAHDRLAKRVAAESRAP
jgi:hypothetical protein